MEDSGRTSSAWRRTIARSLWWRVYVCALVSLGYLVGSTAWAGTLQGTATYRERIALPEEAVFEAVLQDISRADAPAVVLGRSKLDPAGQPPFRFEIPYDDAALHSGHRYSVRATLKHHGRLLFTTDRISPVLDGRNAPLHMLLVSVRGGRQTGSTVDGIGASPASFQGELPGAGNPIVWHVDLLPEGRYRLRTTHLGQPEPNRFDDIGRWTRDESGRIVLRGGREAPVFLMPVEGGAALRKLDLLGTLVESGHNDLLLRLPEPEFIEPRLFLRGMFTYMADAAAITLCVDGQRLPVAMEGDYKTLETAYLEARRQPGQPLMASLEGLITQRPSMEEGHPPQTTLVVERFIAVWPRESCGNDLSDSTLRGTYWKLVRLGDEPVAKVTKQREAHPVFAVEEMRVAGSGGCNCAKIWNDALAAFAGQIFTSRLKLIEPARGHGSGQIV
ncbi:MAG TPA: YbaY family lipoprotein [Desulfobacterales bacterium]|nr:YbaY family lipoprotein [Desulfobacterales bacterium]